MEIGFIGLGKMGFLLAKQLVDAGVNVVAWDKDPGQNEKLMRSGGRIATGLTDLVQSIQGRKIIWMMVPAGDPVARVLKEIVPEMSEGDIIIDGGNSYFKDSIRRFEDLKGLGIHYIDCGTSGGLEGAGKGACLMVGGERSAVESCEKIFHLLAVQNGYLHCGKPGSGHFVKMIHNGIEYGMMQSIAEGFELMKKSDFNLDLENVAQLWSHGSVIRGWLMELTGNALRKDRDLKTFKDIMHHSGEGKWTAQTALELEVPAPVIIQSLQMRFLSQQPYSFSGKMVAALRNEFGGHSFEKEDQD